MTEQQYAAWLKDSAAIRCILVEAVVKTSGGSIVTRYLSNRGYVTEPDETPANTHYKPIVVGGIKFTQSISIEGNTSLSFGDIELNNVDGSLDDWLDDYWTNREIRVYLGDIRWPRSDFKLVLNGVTTGIDSRGRTRINIKLSDKLQRLNTPVSETKLGGTSANKDRLIPVCLGEVHNVEPLLVDASLHEYQVHNGPIEDIIEVRDNGVPISITKLLSLGKFRLNQSPVGTITCSVQGDKPSTYANDCVSLVKRLMTGYGNAPHRFDSSDLDEDSLAAFKADNMQPMGIFLSDRANVLDVCNQLAASIGARLIVSAEGLASLVRLQLPQGDAGTTVTATDMLDRSLEISQMPAVVAGVKIGYCKNWTVQSSLETGIPAEHIDLFAQEWLTTTATDSAAAANFNLYEDPTMQETLLLTAADAIDEADRRLEMFNVQRKVLKYTGFYHLIGEKIGDPQTLKHTRFGLSNGKTGQIISVSIDWTSPHVDFEILI